ncbi:MAG TPA: Fe-S oxidoreductase [Rhodospirillaceae bacterium]|mgnify:CR=1 FL=1|nr:Fe-S oxidoreductase [Rhodospirillaceae bacterium]HAA91156.1 Fe-S oxidoreductase [Rhodospirillaceae bacterium]HAT34461.1 Fe-S oxidoreductase [Rhodospirillaceae bacterium]|tara:strand:+ start:446 stop:832 length:387 start_codon:yes stop_codon:yes gene_type:complete
MAKLHIEATERSPEIDFDFDSGKLAIKGESYPEDIIAFFGPVNEKLETYLSSLNGGDVEVNFELIYFNSSSTKILIGMFDSFDEAAERGNDVTINWRYDEDDDTMEELGEEFAEDLEYATFNMVKVAD